MPHVETSVTGLKSGEGMTPRTAPADGRVLHGIVFVLLTAGALLVPALRRWPWIWAAPFAVYFVLVAAFSPLRKSFAWLRMGRLSVGAIVATVGIMALTSLVLVLFHLTARPDVQSYLSAIPFSALGGVFVAGVVFTIVNAVLEELVFRGILFDALQSQWGKWVTLVATAALFGFGHLRGYPSGPLGASLAALFGLAIGGLRLWTGGLALPILAHMSADATIYGILVYAGEL